MRKIVASALISCLLATGLAGCSQPIDQGSEAPPQSQALLALVGIAGLVIAYVAFRHHNENRIGGGGARSSATAPINVVQLTGSGVDLGVNGTFAGVLESGSPFRFESISTSGAFPEASYFLPAGYAPTAMAIDGSGNEWFVDAGGSVKTCTAPVSINGSCAPIAGIPAIADGFPNGSSRSMTADSTLVIIAVYSSGSARFKAFSIVTGTQADAQSYVYGTALYTADAVAPRPFTCSTGCEYFLFHQNGVSFLATIGRPPAGKQSPLSPIPGSAPGVGSDSSGNPLIFGAVGSPTSGLYELAQFSPSVAPSLVPSARISIAINGVPNTARGSFTLPLGPVHVDSSNNIFALDGSRQKVVIFGAF